MEQRRLGKTGFSVSEIGLGCWQLGGGFGPLADTTANAILKQARHLEVNLWDTADVYGGGKSEQLIGDFADRRGVHVITKFGRNGELFPRFRVTKAKVKESLEGSVRRLKVEALDLVQLHCLPRELLADGEIFEWLVDLRRDGLIRNFGASVETVEEGLIAMRHPHLATLQIIFNLFRQDAAEELLPTAQRNDVGIIVRLPLASGLLSGKFGKNQQFAPQDHRNFNRDGDSFNVGETFSGLPFEKGVELTDTLKGFAPKNWPLAHVALRWILDHPAVSTVIAGVSRPDQLADNVTATRREPLEESLRERLAEFYVERVRPSVRGEI